MTHPFIHIGDLHLAPNARQADRLAALDQIVEYGRGLPYVAAWLIPGDIFHAKSTIADRNAFADVLAEMVSKANVVLVPGNHDAPDDLDLFEYVGDGEPGWVHLARDPRVVDFTTTENTYVAIACLPYPHRAAYVTDGGAPDEVTARGSNALYLDCRSLGDELASLNADISLAIGHANVAGAVSSTGQPQIGQEIELTPAHIEALGVGYVGLNHIHKHQAVGGAVYAGSICRLDFGENEAKGFVVATYDDEAKTWAWAFHELDVPRQLLVTGTIDNENQFWFDDDPKDTHVGADVRVRYRYDRALAPVLDAPAVLAPLFAGARSLKLEGIPTHEAEVRAPEIAAATTVPAKVQAYCARMGIAWTDGLAEKVAALQGVVHDLESQVA